MYGSRAGEGGGQLPGGRRQAMKIGRRVALAAAAAMLGAGGGCFVPATAAYAQRVGPTAAPAPGSAQRRAILDALRPSIEAQIGPNIEFVVREIRVVRGW